MPLRFQRRVVDACLLDVQAAEAEAEAEASSAAGSTASSVADGDKKKKRFGMFRRKK
jgi:hypothetical protein